MVDGHTIDTDGHTITGRRSFVVRFFCVSNSLLPTTCMSVISSVLLSTSLCASPITHTHTYKQANTHILLLFDLFQILSNFVVDCILHFIFGPSLITCFKSRSLISKARYSVYNCTSNHKCTERLSNV